MEQNKKSKLLLGAAIAGGVYWVALVALIIIGTPSFKAGFFAGLSNFAKELTSGGEGSAVMIYAAAAFFSLLAAVVLNLAAYLTNGKTPAYIAAALYLPALNFVPLILCILGAKPKFLQGRKTMLFVAGYTGAIFLLMCAALLFIPGMMIDIFIAGMMLYLIITTLIALILNVIGWRKNSAILTLAAACVYVLSGIGIISAALCFIVFAKLEKPFLQGKKTMLFVAALIGAIALLLWILLCIPESEIGNAMYVVFALITLPAVVLNYLGWQKNSAKLTLIAAIVYILSVFGIPSAALCFIGRARLKKQAAAAPQAGAEQ